MLRSLAAEAIGSAIARLERDGRLRLASPVPVLIDQPKAPEHGDFATNWAMVAAKEAGRHPRELGEALAEELRKDESMARVDVAGPGFVNLTLAVRALTSRAEEAVSLGWEGLRDWNQRRLPAAEKERINVEFVSVNPNGPITIGSGRGAAYGSTLCNVLEAVGHKVHREYYVNDGVNSEQMRQFAESVRDYFLGREPTYYRGDFPKMCTDLIHGSWREQCRSLGQHYRDRRALLRNTDSPAEIRAALDESLKGRIERLEGFVRKAKRDLKSAIQSVSTEILIGFVTHVAVRAQRQDLEDFGVTYPMLDRGDEYSGWQYESRLHDTGLVGQCIDELSKKGVADARPVRAKLKLGKGGKVEQVEFEEQAGPVEDDDPAPQNEQTDSSQPHSALRTPQSTDHAPPSEPPGPAESTPTLWLRSTLFGDDMDRVLRRADGRLTYIASDVAYHRDKFNRPKNADRLVTILGPDHHGYIGRLHAVVAANLMSGAPPSFLGDDRAPENEGGVGGADPLADWELALYGSKERRDACEEARKASYERLRVQIFQLVRFLKDGKPAPMRKRDGNIYALIDLVREIGQKVKPNAPEEDQIRAGRDVARFFYLMRHHDTTFDFDLDLAERQSDENPVFYVQYAHARISSVLAKAQEAGFSPTYPHCAIRNPEPSPGSPPSTPPSVSGGTSHPSKTEGGAPELHPKERALILKALDLPNEVRRCAEDYAVNRLTTFAIELARAFHHFYDQCRVLDPEDPDTTRQRIRTCQVAQASLRAALDLLGVSAPERMDREAQSGSHPPSQGIS